MTSENQIRQLGKEGFTDGMLVAYAILELRRTIADIFGADSQSMPPLEAIAVALGYTPVGGTSYGSIADGLRQIAESLDNGATER